MANSTENFYSALESVEGLLARGLRLSKDYEIEPNRVFSESAVFSRLMNGQLHIIGTRDILTEIVSSELSRFERMKRSVEVAQAAVRLTLAREVASDRPKSELEAVIALAGEMAGIHANITKLALHTKSLSDLEPENALSQKAPIVREVDALTGHVSRLPRQSLQRVLAGELSKYRKAVLGPDRAFALISELLEHTEGRDGAAKEALVLIDSLSQWTDSTLTTAAESFRSAAKDSQAIIERVRKIDVAVTLVLWVSCLILLWATVERQVVVRLTRLTKHIRTISEGNLSTPVLITGSDEVGEVERAVERSRVTSQALYRSNEELKHFAYVAAHDLRAPLRSVTNLVEWTKEDYLNDLPDGAQENLDMIHNRVERLSNHLTALLAYARAGQADEEIGVFDLSMFVDELRSDYVTRPGFDIVLAGVPPAIRTFPTPIRTIVLNLVSNAIKHHDRDEGCVTVSLEVVDRSFVLRVSDDGPGIPKAYHEKIFVLFQTLKSRDDMEGAGLGLALVQKLVASLDAEITIISDPTQDRGTTFQVRLPIGTKAWLETEIEECAA